jgi:hypothetical protein
VRPSGSPLSRDAVHIWIDEPALTCATWRSLVIAKWHAAPSATTVRAMREALTPYVGRQDAFAAINVVEIGDLGTLPEDARAEVVLTQRTFAEKQRALATVIHGEGFWAATVRSITAGLGALSRVKFPQRVFDHVDPATRWIAPLLADVGDARVARALDAIASVRAAH